MRGQGNDAQVAMTAGYKIPRGGLFEFVSAANYAAEILEWTGYAVAAGALPAAAFAFYTFCNVAPRGAMHHRWASPSLGLPCLLPPRVSLPPDHAPKNDAPPS